MTAVKGLYSEKETVRTLCYVFKEYKFQGDMGLAGHRNCAQLNNIAQL